MSSFSEPVPNETSASCSYFTGVEPSVVFWCWNPSTSGFDVLCTQIFSSASELLSPSCQLLLVWIVFSDLSLTSCFRPKNCRWLDAFCFSHHLWWNLFHPPFLPTTPSPRATMWPQGHNGERKRRGSLNAISHHLVMSKFSMAQY